MTESGMFMSCVYAVCLGVFVYVEYKTRNSITAEARTVNLLAGCGVVICMLVVLLATVAIFIN